MCPKTVERTKKPHYQDMFASRLKESELWSDSNYCCRPSQSRRKRETAVMWQDTTLGVRNMVSPQLVEPSEFGDPDYQTTPHRYARIARSLTKHF